LGKSLFDSLKLAQESIATQDAPAKVKIYFVAGIVTVASFIMPASFN